MELCDNDGTYDIYKAVISADAAAIIFNGTKDDGSGATDQSPDITDFANGDAFYMHWDGKNLCSKFDYTPAGGEGGEEEEPGETVSYKVIFHFANTIGWSPLNLYVWNNDGATVGNWPGMSMTKQDDNGYFTTSVAWEATSNTGLNYIFNNGSLQTVDLKLAADLFDAETNTAEVWVELNSAANAEGKYVTKQVSDKPLSGVKLAVSPRVSGNKVTFEYVNDGATSVEVRGTVPGASWEKGISMAKNDLGIWTVTVENLEPAVYAYKFVVDGTTWMADPANGKTDSDGNSVFTIVDPNAKDTNEITINVYYDRADGIYVQENADDGETGTWNAYVWGDGIAGIRKDFTKGENGKWSFTMKVPGRTTHSVHLKPRMSTTSKDWLREESQVDINLDNISSGTIDVYVVSNGTGGKAGTMTYSVVPGADVTFANKIVDLQYDYQTGNVVVTTLEELTDAATELCIENVKDSADDIAIEQIKTSGKKYTLVLNKSIGLTELYQYQIKYDNFYYSISIDTVYASKKFGEEFTYTGTDLGATYTASATTFKVWAPTANAVSVNLYTSGTKGTNDLIKSVPMTGGTVNEQGVWTVTVNGDQNGVYYTYLVSVDGKEVEAVDPYARTTGVNGNRGMVIDLDSTDPAGWAADKNPNPVTSQTDAIIYELHVRDFSIDDSSGVKDAWKGKYMAFTQEGTTTSGGVTTGIDYLADLGITHLHLLPVYDYGSVDETTSSTFNWGYDPVNYNVPEGSYSTDPFNGATRVNEFKQMVMALHENGISVVMDVVYNHVYNADKFCFNNIVPGYFSRVDSNTSGCGNDTASEREMVRKYIVESVLYWHQEYHIDGFRFDLVGLLDVQTINEIVAAVHECCPDVIFYGEGWDMDSTNKEPGTEMAKQHNASKTPGFAYFSDSMRNNIAGDNGKSKGFASGAGNGQDIVGDWLAKAVTWGSVWTTNPQQVVQYASCHDNHTLVDKIILSTGRSTLDSTVIKMNNLAAAYYMTAQGVSFIHAGEEFLREKLYENGKREENSYNKGDYVNHIEWSNLEKDTYAANAEYYKGLIAFRKAHPALRYSTAALVSANVRNVTTSANLLTYRVDGNGAGDDDIFVIFNANSSSQTVNLPEGTWTININGEKAGTASLGTASGSVVVSGISAMVLTKADEGKDEAMPVGPSEAKTVYFSNNKYWSQVYAYAWTGETYHLGAWPGVAMTFVETNDYGEGIYSVNLPAYEDGIEGLIFHNNAGAQTVDFVPGLDGTGYYCTDANSEGKFEVGTYTYRAPVLGSADDYYLAGWINNSDYTGTDYKFGEDGTVTTTFSADSYVYVVNGDASETYMTDGYKGAVSSVIMKDVNKHTLTGEKWDKFLIPGGEEVVITMVKNDDNTVTVSYTTTATAFEDKSGVQDGVTLHAWNWSFDNITANMATIAAQGYTAIQTSPIQVMKEATNGTENTVGSHWWVYYQPVDFVITTDAGNALGTKTDFAEMCAAAEQYGIKIIVDVVANHLGNKTGNDLSDAVPEYLRKDEYWHDITLNITSWDDRENMTQRCLDGLPDLNTGNKEVQGFVLNFLKECVDAGADGFRFDMAKSIETPKDNASFASDFWPTVVGGIQEYAGGDLYIYGEILDDAKIAISAYTEYMSVTDNGWGNHMRSLVASGTAALAEGFYKSAPASNLVIWAESHDTFATSDASQSSAAVSVENINKTWALVAARKGAMGLYLARPESMDQALGVASVTGWANAEVKAVNHFHNDFASASETVGNSGKFAYVVRGNSGIVIVNTAGTTADVTLTVPMADGTYADRISGNVFTVTEGVLTGSIGATGIAVVREAEAPSVVAKIGDVEYTSVAAALEAAEKNQTVVLVNDATEEALVIINDNTLDLNGKTLTVTDYVTVYGDAIGTAKNAVIDTVGGGILKAPRDKIMMNPHNPSLPVWNEAKGGYVFVGCDKFNQRTIAGDNSLKYTFLPYLSGEAYALICAGAETSGVQLKIKASWDSKTGSLPASITLVYTDLLMQQFFANYNPETGKFGKAFSLGLTGTNAAENLTLEVFFESETGVLLTCK